MLEIDVVWGRNDQIVGRELQFTAQTAEGKLERREIRLCPQKVEQMVQPMCKRVSEYDSPHRRRTQYPPHGRR